MKHFKRITVKTCENKNCPYISRKNVRGFCILKNTDLLNLKKCPLPKRVKSDFVPTVKHCKRCEQLRFSDGIQVCKMTSYRPHMMKHCPKNEEATT